ncbi:helix-turn-helix domain-containing protein [Burkholderia sp. Ac-20365]|uniref:GlxA family transcriptional regulator n=1 Tax=Burkholderia sp. Ac-20365 TaxID=2703897 RepID=UPI00197C7591|nr:helix-turn-helix domain-containing protein [Burkholderia sp. Ac-20365]MBN3765810.1 helix-turn-helix domain-containing protein [Burkholderia sp. Ac-20365]
MKIAIVAVDGMQALDMAGALDVFGEANKLLPDACRYDVSLIGTHAGHITCSNGMELAVPFEYTTFQTPVDLLLVTGSSDLPSVRPERDLLDWLRDRAVTSKRIGSISNGAFLLGHAGLLNGKEVTASWADASSLAREFPLVRVRPDKRLIRDGNLLSSAGAASAWHLCLSLVADDWGHELAERIARRLGMGMEHERGPCRCRPRIDPTTGEHSFIAKVQRYVNEHLADDLSIDQLASAVSASRRNFSRLFAKHAQMTPSAFVEEARVDAATKILEGTDVPLKTIAFKCGFHSAAHMRMVFLRRINVTPREYRQQIGSARSRDGVPQLMNQRDPYFDFEATA